jgi:beta-glucosidase
VPAGETADVEVTCDPRAFRRWNDSGWQPLVEGELLIARGLGDVRLRLPLS